MTYATEAGVPVILDAGGEELKHAVGHGPDLVVAESSAAEPGTGAPDTAALGATLIRLGAGAAAVAAGGQVHAVTAAGEWTARLEAADAAASYPPARGALVAGLVPGQLLGWSWPDRLRHALALAAGGPAPGPRRPAARTSGIVLTWLPTSGCWMRSGSNRPDAASPRGTQGAGPRRTRPGRGPSLILLGMDADHPGEPDVASLFAPVAVEETFDGVLIEARQVLGSLDNPVDAELWGSDLIGALASSAAGQASLMTTLTGSLVPAAETASTPEALALLRVFAAVGAPTLRAAAGQAAARLRDHDVADPPWAGAIGAPRVGDCWHYADVGGRQESLTMSFAYGDKQHAISVLIDHGRGGKIRDTWVTKGSGLRDDTEREAGRDPLVVFEMIDPAGARLRLERAISAGECPEQPDQVDDVVAHRALLRARLDLLAAQG